MKSSKQIVTLMVAAAAVAGVLALKSFFLPGAKAVDSVAARSKGPEQAKIQIIEFIDFECPACAYGAKLLHEYMDKHPSDIRLQIKYFPLIKSHRHAMQTALYSECAGRQGKFWEFHDPLMATQQQWSPLINPDPIVSEFLKKAGVDMSKHAACVASEDAAKTIEDDRTLGKSLGVQSTPTYFINNKMVVGGKSLTEELNTYFPQDKPKE